MSSNTVINLNTIPSWVHHCAAQNERKRQNVFKTKTIVVKGPPTQRATTRTPNKPTLVRCFNNAIRTSDVRLCRDTTRKATAITIVHRLCETLLDYSFCRFTASPEIGRFILCVHRFTLHSILSALEPPRMGSHSSVRRNYAAERTFIALREWTVLSALV
jgi:hypothetical protein